MFSWYIFAYQISFRSYVLRNIRLRSFEVNAISVVTVLAKTPARKFHCIQWTKDTERSIIEISFLFEKASFLGYYFFSILCVVPGIRLLHQPLWIHSVIIFFFMALSFYSV